MTYTAEMMAAEDRIVARFGIFMYCRLGFCSHQHVKGGDATDTTTTAGNADAEAGATTDPTPASRAGRPETERDVDRHTTSRRASMAHQQDKTKAR